MQRKVTGTLRSLAIVLGGLAMLGMQGDGGGATGGHSRMPDAATYEPPAEAAAAPARRAPRHFSLLIGVANYQHADSWTDLRNLRGPPGDVGRMRNALRRWGFGSDAATQRVLLDGRATKAGIEASLRWLAESATDSADVIVLYFSGHGSWSPDQDLDAVRQRDEHLASPGDNYDEGLVPWDARDPHDARQLLLDDEIHRWLGTLRTANVTLIIDACFSGTITRELAGASGPLAPTPRGPQPPGASAIGAGLGLREGGETGRHTVLTASSAWERAYERPFQPGGLVSGVFTRALTEALEGAEPDTRFDELIARVRNLVGEGQTPQLEGDLAARLFRVGAGVEVPARGFALASPGPPGRVALDVGALHGVRAGAVYDLFGPAETRFLGGALAQVQVDTVREMTASARVLGNTRAVPARSRAVLSRVPAGARTVDRLLLYVAPSAAVVRDALRSLSWVQVLDQPAGGMAELRQTQGVFQVLVGGHAITPEMTDSVAGFMGQGVAGGGGMRGYAGTRDALCRPLRRAFFAVALDRLRNEAPPASLDVVLRVLPAGLATPTRRASGTDTAFVGERYDVWAWVEVPDSVARRSRLYLSVAIAGYTSLPAVIWPLGTAVNSPLAPTQLNQPLRILSEVRMSPVTGVEELKIVASSDPFDLRALLESVPPCDAGLSRALPGDSLPAEVTGWVAGQRRVAILPRR